MRRRVGRAGAEMDSGAMRGAFAELLVPWRRDDSPDFTLAPLPSGPRPAPVTGDLCVRSCPSKAGALGLCGDHFRRKS